MIAITILAFFVGVGAVACVALLAAVSDVLRRPFDALVALLFAIAAAAAVTALGWGIMSAVGVV